MRNKLTKFRNWLRDTYNYTDYELEKTFQEDLTEMTDEDLLKFYSDDYKDYLEELKRG